jgi:hypothetical protein
VRVHLQIRRGERAAVVGGERPVFERDVYLLRRASSRRCTPTWCGAGRACCSPPRRAPYGIREIVVEDLDGHRLTFGEIESR